MIRLKKDGGDIIRRLRSVMHYLITGRPARLIGALTFPLACLDGWWWTPIFSDTAASAREYQILGVATACFIGSSILLLWLVGTAQQWASNSQSMNSQP
jgi:hypothetical protein